MHQQIRTKGYLHALDSFPPSLVWSNFLMHSLRTLSTNWRQYCSNGFHGCHYSDMGPDTCRNICNSNSTGKICNIITNPYKSRWRRLRRCNWWISWILSANTTIHIRRRLLRRCIRFPCWRNYSPAFHGWNSGKRISGQNNSSMGLKFRKMCPDHWCINCDCTKHKSSISKLGSRKTDGDGLEKRKFWISSKRPRSCGS